MLHLQSDDIHSLNVLNYVTDTTIVAWIVHYAYDKMNCGFNLFCLA